MSEQQFEEEIIQFVKSCVGEETTLTQDTRIIEDLGIDGDDAGEFMTAFAEKFQIEWNEFQWHDYFDSEWWLSITGKPFKKMLGWKYHAKKDLTIRDLIHAAEQRKLPPKTK